MKKSPQFILILLLCFSCVQNISIDAVRKKELIAFTELTNELDTKITKESTSVYYTPYLEQNPTSTLTFEVLPLNLLIFSKRANSQAKIHRNCVIRIV